MPMEYEGRWPAETEQNIPFRNHLHDISFKWYDREKEKEEKEIFFRRSRCNSATNGPSRLEVL